MNSSRISNLIPFATSESCNSLVNFNICFEILPLPLLPLLIKYGGSVTIRSIELESIFLITS